MKGKALITFAIVLYGAVGGWLVYTMVVPPERTDDLPSWVGPFLHVIVFVVYGAGAFLLRRAATSGNAWRIILVPLLFPPAVLAVLVVALIALGGRW